MKNSLIISILFIMLFIVAAPASAGLIDTYSELGNQKQSIHNHLTDDPVFNALNGCNGGLNSITGLGYTSTWFTSNCYNTASGIVNSFTINDLVFSILPGYQNLPDMISAAIHISYYAHSFSYKHGNDNADLSISTRLGSTWDFANKVTNRRLQFETRSVLETHPFSIDISTPQTLQVTAEFKEPTLSNILGNGQHFGAGSLFLRLGGSPVFQLPQGYTVNSKSAHIVNNWYKGYDPLAKNVAVPEPSTLSIFLLAILFISFRLFSANNKHKV